MFTAYFACKLMSYGLDMAILIDSGATRPMGDWHVWKNRKDGGLTGAIRDHMLKYHKSEYLTKCKAEGFRLPGSNNAEPGLNLDGPQPAFTREGLIERLLRFIAVDDQVSGSKCILMYTHSYGCYLTVNECC
jgi:hypothetical protein